MPRWPRLAGIDRVAGTSTSSLHGSLGLQQWSVETVLRVGIGSAPVKWTSCVWSRDV